MSLRGSFPHTRPPSAPLAPASRCASCCSRTTLQGGRGWGALPSLSLSLSLSVCLSLCVSDLAHSSAQCLARSLSVSLCLRGSLSLCLALSLSLSLSLSRSLSRSLSLSLSVSLSLSLSLALSLALSLSLCLQRLVSLGVSVCYLLLYPLPSPPLPSHSLETMFRYIVYGRCYTSTLPGTKSIQISSCSARQRLLHCV
eukprot:COSAG02_NODE_5432_length_4334_cov_3.769067_1_plen_198_part_00